MYRTFFSLKKTLQKLCISRAVCTWMFPKVTENHSSEFCTFVKDIGQWVDDLQQQLRTNRE